MDYAGMMESYSIHDVMLARIQDLEEMLYLCMELEKKTGKEFSGNALIPFRQKRLMNQSVFQVNKPTSCM